MIKLTRRAVAFVLFTGGVLYADPSTPDIIAALHADIDERFIIRPQGLILDYVNADASVDLPVPAECQSGKPNALSWWTPLENGPFLTGLYLDAVLHRWRATGAAADLQLARELVSGLLACASLDGAPPGFVARGFYGAERAYYGIGSDDQTAPWFYGLWKYLRSGAASAQERVAIINKMKGVAEALKVLGWRIPCAPVGDLWPNQYRGDWSIGDYRAASRRVFVARIVYTLTGEIAWEQDYRAALAQRPNGNATRLDLIAAGMTGEWQTQPSLAQNHLWIYVVSQAMVRELHELEADPLTKTAYLQSLAGNAALCAPKVLIGPGIDVLGVPFRSDWRSLNAFWEVQRTPGEAANLALDQLLSWGNGGRRREIEGVREPACAAWIAFLAPKSTAQIAQAALRFESFLGGVPWADIQSSSAAFAVPAAQLAGGHLARFSYADWRLGHWSSSTGDSVAGATADADGDGRSNLLEYATGSSPVDQTAAFPELTAICRIEGHDYLTLTFVRNRIAADVTWSLLASDGLGGTWSRIDPLLPANQLEVLENTPAPGLQRITVKDTQSLPAASGRFLRLETRLRPSGASIGFEPEAGYTSGQSVIGVDDSGVLGEAAWRPASTAATVRPLASSGNPRTGSLAFRINKPAGQTSAVGAFIDLSGAGVDMTRPVAFGFSMAVTQFSAGTGYQIQACLGHATAFNATGAKYWFECILDNGQLLLFKRSSDSSNTPVNIGSLDSFADLGRYVSFEVTFHPVLKIYTRVTISGHKKTSDLTALFAGTGLPWIAGIPGDPPLEFIMLAGANDAVLADLDDVRFFNP